MKIIQSDLAVDKACKKIININIIALTNLIKCFLKDIIERKEGGILNIASTAVFIRRLKMSIYYSSKAYVLSQEKSGIKKSEKAKKYLMDASNVAEKDYLGFIKGKTIIILGYKNKLLILVNKLIPRTLSRKIILKNNS